jgi:hypothetical protein
VQQSFSTGRARALAGAMGPIVVLVIVSPDYLGRHAAFVILEVCFDILRISD